MYRNSASLPLGSVPRFLLATIPNIASCSTKFPVFSAPPEFIIQAFAVPRFFAS